MKCPNCNAPRLYTVSTFQTDEETIRSKKCKACEWTFTSKEYISDELVIPAEIRNTRWKEGADYRRNLRARKRANNE